MSPEFVAIWVAWIIFLALLCGAHRLFLPRVGSDEYRRRMWKRMNGTQRRQAWQDQYDFRRRHGMDTDDMGPPPP